MPHTRSVAAGIFAGVGSRYEDETQRGVSHFIEHMMFKGTERRPTAQHIAEAIEGLGGVINANTGNEVTTYWAKVAHHHLPLALDVLVDMLRHSRLEPTEIDKERQVIIQEINRMMDAPASWVHALISELIWPEHPLGGSIAGTVESVSRITRQDILSYIEHTYTPRNVVISLAGNVDHDDAVSQLTKELSTWPDRTVPSYLPVNDASLDPGVRVEFKDTEQAHLCIGMRGLSLNNPDRFKLRVLNAVLGEGMSSRLFLEIREKRGLAYSVGSYTLHLRDTGALVLYAGVPPQQAADTISAIMEQLDIIRGTEVSTAELSKAKEFTKGRILLRMEDTFANASWWADQEVLDREVLTVDQVMERLDAVTPHDVQAIAQQLLLAEKVHLAVVGPFKNAADLSARLKL
jgi:predicted Zn-dependent peptidase